MGKGVIDSRTTNERDILILWYFDVFQPLSDKTDCYWGNNDAQNLQSKTFWLLDVILAAN